MFNASCIYGSTFESIVPKNNAALLGRDRISHPIIMDTDCFAGEELDFLTLHLVFLGPAIPHFPYFYYALKKGGEAGIMKERIPFQVGDIIEENSREKRSLVIDDQRIETRIKPEVWEYQETSGADLERDIRITLHTPLRFKSQGQYARQLTPADLAYCFHRRIQVLCSQYGHNDSAGDYQFSGGWTITEQHLLWRDFAHYSARQKKAMHLGGLTGTFTLSGRFSPYEYALLHFAERFHSGKNTNFGLGKLEIQEKIRKNT